MKGKQTATIKYGTTSGTYDLTTAPTRIIVGTTTVYYQVTAPNHTTQSGSYTITVNMQDIEFKATDQTKVYDGSALSASNTATITSGSLVSGHTATFTCSGSITNVGSTTKTLSSVIIRNSRGTDVTSNFKITKINGTLSISNASFTVNVPNHTYIYNGTPRGTKLIEISNLKGGQKATVRYGESNGSYNSNTPITRIDAGKTTVYYQVEAPYHTTQSGSYLLTVNKATTAAPILNEGYKETYDGSLVFATAANASNNPAGMIHYYNAENDDVIHTLSVTAGSTTPINLDKVGRKQVGTTTIWAFFIPSDTVNYSKSNRVSTTAKVANKATPTMTLTGILKTYDGNTYYVSGKASIPGKIYYGTTSATSGMTSSAMVSANTATNIVGRKDYGTTTVYAYFVPNDTTNYNSLGSSSNDHTSASVIIRQRIVTITAPTATNRTYNGITQKIFEEGSCTTGGVMYYSRTGGDFSTSTSTWRPSLSLADASADNAGTYTLYYYCYVKDEKNNIGEGINTIKSVSATIDKKATAAPILTEGYLETYDKSITVYAKAANASNNPAGTIYYGSSSGATTYSISASTTASYLSNMGQHSVGTTTIYVFFRPSDTTNYYDSPVVLTTAKVANKAEGFLTATINSEFTYDGSAHTIATNKESSGGYYFGTSSSTTIAPTSWGLRSRALKRTDAGTYYVWGKCDASTNYNAVDAKYLGTAIIRQRIVTAPTATNRIYSGSAQTIFDAGSCGDGGVMYYSSTDIPFSTSTWSTTLPYTQKTAIGKYTLYYYCYVSDTSNNKGVGINTVNSVSATIDRVIEDYINMVTCDTVESVDKWTTTLNLNNNLIMPTHWIEQKIYFRVYDKNKVLIPRPKNEPSQYSFRITQDFTTGNSKDIEIITGAQASLCGEKYGLVEPRYIKIEQKEGTNLSENYVPFAGRYIDVDYIY